MKNLLLFFAFFCLSPQLFTQEPDTALITEYTIHGELHDQKRTLDGFLKVKYFNNSPDTISYIWFKLVPNAYKNDLTAFSEHMLENNRIDFYFATNEKKGYLNGLSFREEDRTLKMEEHPHFIDLVKVILNKPVYPGYSIMLVTPFHVKIPYRFDELGYDKTGYSLRYWYPAIAAYSKEESGAWIWDDKPYTGIPGNIQKAIYNVTISIPSRYNIKSNGKLLETVSSDSVKRCTFQSDLVSDFSISIKKQNDTTTENKNSINVSRVCKILDRLQQQKILPAAGYNIYDGLQAGILFQTPLTSNSPVSYHAAPLFAFRSKKLTGAGEINFRFNGGKLFNSVVAGISGTAFSRLNGTDSNGTRIFGSVEKLTPSLIANWNTPNTKINSHLEYRFFLLRETEFQYTQYSFDSMYYPSKKGAASRYVNQVTYHHMNRRVLYPYSATIQFQQGKNFYRLNATGSYFFNYAKGGGLNVRMFVSKFGYLGHLTSSEKFRMHRYKPKLTVNNGYEDFTYSNYFIARNDPEILHGETMMRDGNLKIRTDIFDGLQGRSDKWVASLNFNTTLPQLTHVALPLRLFADVGTHAGAWNENFAGSRFMYVAGLHLSLFKGVANVYAPVIYSREIRDRLKSVPEENKFFRKIIFNLSFQNLQFSRPLCKQIF